jgi:hypothetical protein
VEFGAASFDDLDQHAMEQLVFGDGAISPVLRGHLFVERVLVELISRSLKRPSVLFAKDRMSFATKVDLASAMGLLTDEYVSAFKALNNIRNEYAHSSSFDIEFGVLNGLKFDWEPIQHKAYEAACAKGPDEAARIAVIFLCWKAIHLIASPPG